MDNQIELRSKRDYAEKYDGLLFSTGNKVIDAEIGHMRDREIMLLHGPSKNGKTSYVISQANLNGLLGHKVALFSLEMTKKNLKMQQSIVASGMSRVKFESGTYTAQQWEKYETTYNEFDKNFTIYDDSSLPPGHDGYTLDTLIHSIKMLQKEGYSKFIIDSLGLIGGGNGMSTNAWQSKIVRELRKVKNSLPIGITLIHHNHKGGGTFSGSQDLENFVDWRIEVKKYLDPNADGIVIFHQTKIRVFKERLGKELEFVFDYDRGKLIYNTHGYITDDKDLISNK